MIIRVPRTHRINNHVYNLPTHLYIFYILIFMQVQPRQRMSHANIHVRAHVPRLYPCPTPMSHADIHAHAHVHANIHVPRPCPRGYPRPTPMSHANIHAHAHVHANIHVPRPCPTRISMPTLMSSPRHNTVVGVKYRHSLQHCDLANIIFLVHVR